jgi:hypothetical protein
MVVFIAYPTPNTIRLRIIRDARNPVTHAKPGFYSGLSEPPHPTTPVCSSRGTRLRNWLPYTLPLGIKTSVMQCLSDTTYTQSVSC